MIELDHARYLFDIQIKTLEKVKDSLNDEFISFLEKLSTCKGNIVFTGMGKSGHICRKIVATMQSLGIKTFFLHPAEGVHGDLGCLSSNDMIVAVSNSGETTEILNLLPSIEKIGLTLLCIVGNKNSTLYSKTPYHLLLPDIKEAYLDGLVPTSSTTATLVLGDTIAICLAESRNFNVSQFAIYHPRGTLGKKMTLKIKDIMVPISEDSVVLPNTTIRQVVYSMCKNQIGGIIVGNEHNKINGVFSDGDLRRLLNTKSGIALDDNICDVMCKKPITINEEDLVIDTIHSTLANYSVSFFPVLNKEEKIVGIVRIQDFVKSGLM